MKYMQTGSNKSKQLLYDGHKSHIHPEIIEFARNHDITLFVLPPHTSHLLQPLDVACFGPLQKFYDQEAQKFLLQNPGRVISKYDVASIASKAYTKALCPNNVVAAFRKTVIYPRHSSEEALQKLPPEKINPSKIFRKPQPNCTENRVDEFLKSKNVETVFDNSEAVVKKVRNTVSRVVAGKATTDDDVFSELRSRQEVGKNEKRKSQDTNVKLKSKKQEILVAMQQFHSQAHLHTMFQIVRNQ